MNRSFFSDPVRYVTVTNSTTEDVPPFGLMRITGVGADDTFVIGKPTANNSMLLVNGPLAIPAGEKGQGSFTFPAVVGYTAAGEAPEIGDSVGTVTDKWYVEKTGTGFGVMGVQAGAEAVTRLLVDKNAGGFNRTITQIGVLDLLPLDVNAGATYQFTTPLSFDEPGTYLVQVSSVTMSFITALAPTYAKGHFSWYWTEGVSASAIYDIGAMANYFRQKYGQVYDPDKNGQPWAGFDLTTLFKITSISGTPPYEIFLNFDNSSPTDFKMRIFDAWAIVNKLG